MNSENIQKIIEEFRNDIYGKDDALFDRKGNNVSRQVENFLLSSLKQIHKETLEEIELDIEKLKKYHKEFECGGLYEDFCEDQNCENAPKEYNQAINDVIDFIQSKK